MEAMLAAVRAADHETLYSLYFPDGGRVEAAAVARCVCLDDLTCTECERILGVSFLAIELAARKKLRTDPPVPVARVDAGPGQGPGTGSHRVEGSGKAISFGKADRLGRGSRPPSDGIEGSGGVISSMVDRPGRGSRPPSDGIERSGAAISSLADRRLEPGSHPPSDEVEGSVAAISGTADRPVPGSNPPSDGIVVSESPISSIGDQFGPCSNGLVEGFEAAISRMAARVGLAAAVGERAKEVFRKMEEARAWPPGPGRTKYWSKCPLAYAACLSIACRNEGTARSLRELSLATADGGSGAAAASRWEIARLIAHIRRRLGEEEAGQGTGIGMVSVSSFTRRFGALVGLGEAERTLALEAARRLDEGVLDVRHNLDSLAAAVVCMALERAGAKRPGVKDVAAATGFSDGFIHTVCRKLRDHGDLLFG